VLAREKLHRLLSGGVDREANIVSVFVAAVTRMVVQELIEGEQTDHRAARGQRRSSDTRPRVPGTSAHRDALSYGGLRDRAGRQRVVMPNAGRARPLEHWHTARRDVKGRLPVSAEMR